MRVDADIFDPDDLTMMNDYYRLTKAYPYLKWDHVISLGLIEWGRRACEDAKKRSENEPPQ